MLDSLFINWQLTNCEPIRKATGGASIYAADCLVRHLIEAGWPGLIKLGWKGDDIKIEAGIGTLYLSATKQIWTPTIKGTPPPAPLPADPVIAHARQAVCDGCTRYESGRCQVAGCGCAGQGVPSVQFSKCPLGKWDD